jgi:hypothetical protein
MKLKKIQPARPEFMIFVAYDAMMSSVSAESSYARLSDSPMADFKETA